MTKKKTVATLEGKPLTQAKYSAWKKKQDAIDKKFWNKQISDTKKEIARLKKELPKLKKLSIKVYATATQLRIEKLESKVKNLKK